MKYYMQLSNLPHACGIGNVLVTVSDKKIAKTHGTTAVDYFDPDVVTITDYYAFGAPMPGRHGVENCYIDTIINIDSMYVDMIVEDFSSGIGLFDGTVINDNTSISNVTGDELHIEAIWPHNAVGNRYVTLVNGTTYTLTFDLVNSASIGSSTMECAILIPGNIQAQAISSGANSFTFTSSYSGSVAIEFSYITDQSSTYSASVPSFDIDNVIIKEYVLKEEFAGISVGSFVPNSVVSPSTAIANVGGGIALGITATWPDNPTAYAPMYLENGVTYNVSYDLNSIYYMAGTDTVECRIHLPSGSIVNQYTSTGTHSFSFMSTTTGWVDIEYAYLTDQDSMYTFWMTSIEIDNVLVTREIINEDFSSSSIGAFVSMPGPPSVLSASSGTLRISNDEPFRAAAERLIPVTAGHKYSIDFDITHIYNLGVIPHDVRLRVEMAGYPTQHYTFPGLLSIPTVYVNVPTGFAGTDIRVEISSIMSSSAHTLGSFIEIDNFKVKHWEGVTSYTFDTICSTNGKRYRYGFNGKEKDNETYGEGNAYDFGARIYDSRLGRTLTLDPAKLLYPGISPYAFAMNTPHQAIDPDGRVVIFINGMWGPVGGISEPKQGYWTDGSKDKNSWVNTLKEHWNDQNALFYDGSVGGQYNSRNNISSNYRNACGKINGYNNAKSIIANLGADETIKFVTNSMGAAYQRGFSDGLMTFISEQKSANIQAQQGVMNNIQAIENQMRGLLESPLFTNFQYDLLQSQLNYENQKLTELQAEHSKLDNIKIEIVVDIEPFQQTERDPNAKNHYFVLSDKTDYGTAEKLFPIVGGIQPVTGATDASKKPDGNPVTTGHHSGFTKPKDLPKL